MIQLASKAPIHASDHVVLQRHARFLRGFRILPPEVLSNVLGQSFDHGPSLALLILDLDLDPLLHLDGVDLWRPLVQRPEVLVDADVLLRTCVDGVSAFGRPDGGLYRIGRTYRREWHGWCGWLSHRGSVRQSGAANCDIGTGDTMLAERCCSGSVDVRGLGGASCCRTDLDWRSGALDTERIEASEPGPNPTGESDRSAQRR